MDASLLDQLNRDRADRKPVALVTQIDTGAQALVHPHDATGMLAANADVVAAARKAMADDKSGVVESPAGNLFIQVFNPPLRLIVVGAVHIAQPLARMAVLSGYDVTVVDPRGSFATAERFPGVTLMGEWPDDAMAALKPDKRTAVVTLTHDPKLDDPALAVALKSDAFYVGSLGSRKTHAARCERLTAQGFDGKDLARIHGPVGLNIGAVSPAEIAVSILGQVTEVLRAKDAA